MIETQVPFDLINHIYTRSAQHHEMLNSDRFYYKLIMQVIAEGQENGEFVKEESPEILAEKYASLERGLIYDWCVKKGETSLLEAGQEFIPIYLEHLLL